jgi:Spy/CpxP family protein refolding chaperone
MSLAPTRHDLDERPKILTQIVMRVGHDLTRSPRQSFLMIRQRKYKYLHYITRFQLVAYPQLVAAGIFTKNKMKASM